MHGARVEHVRAARAAGARDANCDRAASRSTCTRMSQSLAQPSLCAASRSRNDSARAQPQTVRDSPHANIELMPEKEDRRLAPQLEKVGDENANQMESKHRV